MVQESNTRRSSIGAKKLAYTDEKLALKECNDDYGKDVACHIKYN